MDRQRAGKPITIAVTFTGDEPAPTPASADDTELDDAIHKIDDSHVTIRAGWYAKAMDKPKSFVRAVPLLEDGKLAGVKIYGIHDGSAAARVGLMNGDILKSVGPFDFTSPDREKFHELRTVKAFEIHWVRRDTPMTMNVTIVD
jgi:type II secretory pathway component PulC